jgi:mRNA interferase HicA
MKRRDIVKRMRQIARDKGVTATTIEHGRHTKIMFDGIRVTTIPRHNEINELTAKGIIKAMEEWSHE